MKKSKKTKKSRKQTIVQISIVVLILIALAVVLYFFLNAPDDDNKLTLIEKQWVEKNKDKLININVPNNLSILGTNGDGVLFDYLDKVKKELGLSFNMVSYNYPLTSISDTNDVSLLVLSNHDDVKSDDILIMQDSYVLAGTESAVYTSQNDFVGKKVGVLKEDSATLITLLGKNTYVYKSYNSISYLIKGLKSGEVDYILVPRYANLSVIVSNNLNINYDFNNISNKIVLRLGGDEKLNSILSKYLRLWLKNDYNKAYREAIYDFYVTAEDVSEADISKLTTKVYKYGFVEGNSYNILKNKTLYGVAGEYANYVSDVAKMDIEEVMYSSNQELSNAIKSGEVDFAFIDYDFTSENGFTTTNLFDSKFMALSHNYYDISDKNSLINRKLYVLERGNLYKYVKDNIKASVNPIKSVSANVENDGLLILNDVDYMYHRNELGSYQLLFMDEYLGNYHFFVNSNSEILYKLLDFTIRYGDYYDHKDMSTSRLLSTIKNESSFKQVYLLIICIILIPIFLVALAIAVTKTKSKFRLNHKVAALKYNDVLTSLKNRNYLNDNIDLWDEAKITPRTVIMIDLNNVKYVNDNYGHEEGNNLIKKAAAILINNQLENSEIVRTDGNEFLIYLIGYNQGQIKNYINKLSKEFEKLPYGFGAAIGFSMILDEIKTVDDAINEASIEMRTDKEQNFG